MSLLTDILLRTIIIVTVTDALIFYVMNKRNIKPDLVFAIEVILVTLIPLIINILYVFYRFNALQL
jgi:hypothetical protein